MKENNCKINYAPLLCEIPTSRAKTWSEREKEKNSSFVDIGSSCILEVMMEILFITFPFLLFLGIVFLINLFI